MKPAVHPRAQALAAALKARRAELNNMSMDTVAARGGPRKPTQVEWEKGNISIKPQEATLDKYNRALDLPDGHLQAILAGADVERVVSSRRAHELPTVEEMQSRINNIAQNLWGARTEAGIPAPVERAINAALIDALRLVDELGEHGLTPPGSELPERDRTPGDRESGVLSR